MLRERGFVERLNESHESHMKRLSDTHREKVALLDRQFLQQKQQLMRAREAALWEMEERQLHERHQLAKRQLKDMFFLQRHQMLVHHEKELDHLKRMMERREEEMAKNQAVERRALPKRIRAEMKAREMMYRYQLDFFLPGFVCPRICFCLLTDLLQGEPAYLGDEPAGGDHAHGGEGQVQEVPGGREEEVRGNRLM